VAQAFLGMHQDPRGRDILQRPPSRSASSADAYFTPSDGSEYAAYRDYRTAPPNLR
jgi:phosphonate transport system substrate-binding protein